jgi:glucosylceramidase
LGIIRVIKLAQEVARAGNLELKFFGSAWSPPAWMKSGGKIVAGKNEDNQLKNEMIGDYAAYLRKAVQAYEHLGIPIWAVTTGNEHHYSPPNYPGCFIPQEAEAALVVALHEEFTRHKLSTKIWIHDHNWDNAEAVAGQVLTLLGDPKHGPDGTARRFVDAVALHHYGGGPSQMAQFHAKFPHVALEFTEGSVWGVAGMDEIVQIFRTGHRSYVSWVPMRTQNPTEHNQGPYNTTKTLGPTLMVQSNGDGRRWYKTPEFHLIGQFSKFVRPGAVRIESSKGSNTTLTNVAFKNRDGSIAVVVVNQTVAAREVRLACEGKQICSAIPAKSIATYVFHGFGRVP